MTSQRKKQKTRRILILKSIISNKDIKDGDIVPSSNWKDLKKERKEIEQYYILKWRSLEKIIKRLGFLCQQYQTKEPSGPMFERPKTIGINVCF